MRYSFFEIALGAIILIITALFAVYALQYSDTILNPKKTTAFHAIFDEIDQLPAGADVRINGIKVGQVIKQSLDPETLQSNVSFFIDAQYHLPIDSKVVINSDGLLGANYVQILPGYNKEKLTPNAHITNVENVLSLEDIIGKAIFIISETATQTNKAQ